MKVTAKLSGFKELQDTLAQLPRSTARGVVRRVLISRAKPIADTARALAPVDTGFLRASITVTTKLSKRHRSRIKDGKKDVNVHIATSRKAHLQEYGTRHNPPQPFMRPAWDAHKGSLTGDISKDMWAEIKKVLQRRAKRAAKLAEAVAEA